MNIPRFAFLSVVLVNLTFYGASLIAAPGDLYVLQSAAGSVLRFSPDGTKATLASGLDQPSWITFDRAGNLFVSQREHGNILKFHRAVR